MRRHPRPRHYTGMDTSTVPHISPTLEPESLAALMLHYVEDREEVAYQYARALMNALATADDLQVSGVLCLARDIVTESTNDIRNFEGEEVASRIDVALRRLIDRAEADEIFMTELTELAD